MIRSTHFAAESVDLVPVALVARPLDAVLAGRAEISRDLDDLDWFDGADFILDRTVKVAVRHYDGHPGGTCTIYVDRRSADPRRSMRRVVDAFEVGPADIVWLHEAAAPDARTGTAGRRAAVGSGG